MGSTNLMMVGGFLGAGKTTSIVSIARYWKEQGKRVGIITNGHGEQIVDTEYLSYQGFDVQAITGGCLGCDFNQFSEKLIALRKEKEYDYILVEPVGSCVDLVATMMKPIRHGRINNCKIMPLSIIVDPIRILNEVISIERYMTKETEYLILKQMEEADIIVVNRVDILSKAEIKKLDTFFAIKYSSKKVIYISAKKNYGINLWAQEVESLSIKYRNYGRKSLELNYDTYAKAEAQLGWLTLRSNITTSKRMSGNYFVSSCADTIKRSLKVDSCEIGHMKIYLETSTSICKLSCNSLYRENIFDRKLKYPIDSGRLLINLRVNMEAEKLKEMVEASLDSVINEFRGEVADKVIECFAPPYPKPSYRYS